MKQISTKSCGNDYTKREEKPVTVMDTHRFGVIDMIHKKIEQMRAESDRIKRSKEHFKAIRSGQYMKEKLGEPVIVHVYRMSTVGRFTSKIGLGIYHAGVEVHGKEYSFGASETPGTGVYVVKPRQAGNHMKLKESILIGYTQMKPSDVDLLVDSMKSKYQTDAYHLLKRNCCSFSSELTEILCKRSIPKWINKSARRLRRLSVVKRIPDEWCRL